MDGTTSSHVAVESTYYVAQYSKNFEILNTGTNDLFSVNPENRSVCVPNSPVSEPDNS